MSESLFDDELMCVVSGYQFQPHVHRCGTFECVHFGIEEVEDPKKGISRSNHLHRHLHFEEQQLVL